MIKIEKGVPIPAARTNSNNCYPWREMEVGDSFVIPGMDRTAGGSRVHYANQLGIGRFTLRSFDGGVRVWRIE